jgi:FAD dependent oxidoreductase
MLNCFNHEKIPVLAEVDVLICGAGSAGCAAALTARECGKYDVLLLERYGFPGGWSTQVLDTFYGFFTPGDTPRKVAGGIPDRVVNRLNQTNSIFLRPNTYGAGTGVTYDPERLKFVWDELLAEAQVKVLLHSFLVDVETSAGGELSSVVISTKRGFYRIKAKRYIDATGDADLCRWADVPFERAGDIEPAQTLTTTFRMSNVDLEKFARNGGKKMLNEKMRDAVESGTHPLPRKSGSVHAMVHPNSIATVAVRVADIDGTDFEQLTQAEQIGRKQAYIYEKFLRDVVSGYESSVITGLSTQIGVRESRRVYGEYRLTKSDCLSAAKFDDVVFLCGAPIEDHRQNSAGEEETVWGYIPNGAAYEVSYRTLVPRGRDDLWVAGRCFSATHDAHASCRSMAQTMSMGQAAGIAAALSLDENCGARQINVAELQDRLLQLGAILEIPSKIALTGAGDWAKNF